MIVPNLPHHVVQRGHNRNAVFVEDTDYQYYLATLEEWKTALSIRVYAWCLMTNHVHLILDPGEDRTAIGLLMKRLAGRQTRYVNKQERRSGTLWEGRYKASAVQTDSYLLQCCRYVELNPVKAAMVAKAEAYPWSSYRTRLGLEYSAILDPMPLAYSVPEYQRFMGQGITPEENRFFLERLERNGLTGDGAFVDEVERRIGLRIETRAPGRPCARK
ncbi:MAG: transposase [Halioglobus sp.]